MKWCILHFRKIISAVGWKGNGREGGYWPGNQPDDCWQSLESLAKASPVRLSVLFSVKCGPDHFIITVSLRNIYSSQTILFIFLVLCSLHRFSFQVDKCREVQREGEIRKIRDIFLSLFYLRCMLLKVKLHKCMYK